MWQVTAAYLAGGLTVLLAVGERYDEFSLPEGTPRIAATLLGAGLPIAVLSGLVLFEDARSGRPAPVLSSRPPVWAAEAMGRWW